MKHFIILFATLFILVCSIFSFRYLIRELYNFDSYFKETETYIIDLYDNKELSKNIYIQFILKDTYYSHLRYIKENLFLDFSKNYDD